MESLKPSANTQAKSRVAHAFGKVRHFRAANGICPIDGIEKEVCREHIKLARNQGKKSHKSDSLAKLAPKSEEKVVLESLLAKIFATISSVKAAYAQLQHAQCMDGFEAIRAADGVIVTELTNLSELKQSFLKKQFDPHPPKTVVLARMQEQRSLLETYEVSGKKLESQLKLKESEITFLKEKIEELNEQNRFLEKRLSQSDQTHRLEYLGQAGLEPRHFLSTYRCMVKSIQNFVRVMVKAMISASWDIDFAANSVEPGVSYHRAEDKCFAFEKFVCRTMFDGFHILNFYRASKSSKDKNSRRQRFLNKFSKLKSKNAKEYLHAKPKSRFAEFCRLNYLNLIHPKMESSVFGCLDQRNQIKSGRFPDTEFFACFLEMAKQVWLLHCLALSSDPEASLFQASKGCRFSLVYMEAVNEEALCLRDPEAGVAFTVFPGFKIHNTVVQCRVYLSQRPASR